MIHVLTCYCRIGERKVKGKDFTEPSAIRLRKRFDKTPMQSQAAIQQRKQLLSKKQRDVWGAKRKQSRNTQVILYRSYRTGLQTYVQYSSTHILDRRTARYSVKTERCNRTTSSLGEEGCCT